MISSNSKSMVSPFKLLFWGIMGIVCLGGTPFSAHAYTFTRDLTVGSTGEDVFQLQKFLNTDIRTQVSLSEAGSPGNESYYFGEKTKQAVIKLQNLYVDQILKPVGLMYGSGFFGNSTRTFLNSQTQTVTSTNGSSTGTSAPVIVTQVTTNPSTNTKTDVSAQYTIIEKTLLPNSDVLVFGNDIHTQEVFLGENSLDKECDADYVCSIHIPKNTKAGQHNIYVGNTSSFVTQIQVLSSDIKRPSVSLKTLKLNTANTITGKNLTDTVKVYTTFGVFDVQTNDNEFTITPTISSSSLPSYLQTGIFKIENNNGSMSESIQISHEL